MRQLNDYKNILKNNSEQHILRQIEQMCNRNKELQRLLLQKNVQINKERQKQFMYEL